MNNKEQLNILITGQNRGLGKALAERFSKDNKVLYHGGRKDFDLSSVSDIEKLGRYAKEHHVDMLINNAAVVCPSINLSDYSIEKIQSMVNVNLLAPIILSNILVDNLKYIININSMVGLEVKSPRTLYSATKWGLRGFSNSLKKENKNIKILDVYPTNIKTTPDRENAMELSFVVGEIHKAFLQEESELILDGRKM